MELVEKMTGIPCDRSVHVKIKGGCATGEDLLIGDSSADIEQERGEAARSSRNENAEVFPGSEREGQD